MLKRVSNWLRNIADYLSPQPERKFSLTATITSDDNVDYKLTKDLSPELFAKLIVRMAIMTDGAKFVKTLTENGYVDAFYRLQTTSNAALASIFDIATRPDKVEVITAEDNKVETAEKAEVVERPVIEALVG